MNEPGTAASEGRPEIPQSDALKEATEVDSLAEVMSRDPEGLSRQDRDRIIEALRQQRARIAQAEASGAKVPRAAKQADKIPLSKVATKTLDEMGI